VSGSGQPTGGGPTTSGTGHPPVRLEPGEPRLAAWLETSAARLLEQPLSGSMREDLFRLGALDRLGHHALVRDHLYEYRRRQRLSGELRGVRPGAEDTPCALWSLVDHARLTGDVAYLKAVYGTVRRGARRLARVRLPDSSVPHSGLMPLPRGLPEEALRNRYPLALWTLAGAQESARAAAALGRGGDLHDFEAFFQELKRALRRSLEAHRNAGGTAGLPEDPEKPERPADPERPTDPEKPTDPEGSIDSARVDILLALLPGDLFPPDWEPLSAALEGRPANGPETELGRLVAAHHLLRRGDARVWDRLISGTETAGSATPGSEPASNPTTPVFESVPDLSTPNSDQAASEQGLTDALRALLVRNLLVSEAHDLLLVAPGFGLRAPHPGGPVVVERAPTRFGPLSYTLTPHPDGLELAWAGLERTPPGHFIWPLPAPVLRVEPPLATLTATRRALRLEPAGGHLRVVLGPA
jgi:hypothetical protein